MKEFSPEEIKKLDRSRGREEIRLESEGAVLDEKQRLHITTEQYKDAYYEMLTDMMQRPVLKFEGVAEIHESRTFTPEEVRTKIAEVEEVAPEDIKLVQIKEDKNGNILWMDFKLREGIAFSKYHRPVAYFFQLKGVFTPKITEAGAPGITARHDVTEVSRDLMFTDQELAKLENDEEEIEEHKGEIIARYLNGKWTTYGPLLEENDD